MEVFCGQSACRLNSWNFTGFGAAYVARACVYHAAVSVQSLRVSGM